MRKIASGHYEVYTTTNLVIELRRTGSGNWTYFIADRDTGTRIPASNAGRMLTMRSALMAAEREVARIMGDSASRCTECDTPFIGPEQLCPQCADTGPGMVTVIVTGDEAAAEDVVLDTWQLYLNGRYTATVYRPSIAADWLAAGKADTFRTGRAIRLTRTPENHALAAIHRDRVSHGEETCLARTEDGGFCARMKGHDSYAPCASVAEMRADTVDA